MRLQHIWFAAAGAAVLIVGLAPPALAEGNGVSVNAANQGRFQRGQCALPNFDPCTSSTAPSMTWTNVSDSPTDTNVRALVVTVPPQSASFYYFASFYTSHSRNLKIKVANVRNLSFEYNNTMSVGGGAPRISVQFLNGDVGYLSAEYCRNPEAIKPSWSRADFTGGNASNQAECSVLVTGTTGGTYTQTATQSAWQVYATAHPEQVLTQAYMVWDVDPGTYAVDRISLGTGYLYNSYNTTAVSCGNNEAKC